MLFHALLYLSYAALNTAAMAAAKASMRSLDAAARLAALGWFSTGGLIYLAVLAVMFILMKVLAPPTRPCTPVAAE